MKSFTIFKNTVLEGTFKFELSYILVPATAILYFYYPISRPILFHHLNCIGLIGIYDTILKKKYNSKLFTYLSILFHSLLCLSLLRMRQDGDINLYSLILLLVANLIIKNLPYWPYLIERCKLLYFYNFIYFALVLVRPLLK